MPPTEIIEGLVTTIIPVHNRPSMLRDAVASALAQTYSSIEIIIVDDASSDDTPTVCAEIAAANQGIVRVIRLDINSGPGAAREAGRLEAHGEFIQYLDSDDILLPDKFRLQVDALRRRPDCGIAYGKTRHPRLGSLPVDIAWKRTGEDISSMFPSFLRSRWWGTSTPLYKRAVTDAAGSWVPLWQEEDWEYDCRIAALGTKLVHCASFLSETRSHDGPSLSDEGGTSPRLLADRATAHSLILSHARAAGIPKDAPEMRHFSRELFLIARQCGAAGLMKESRNLFRLSRQSSTRSIRHGVQFGTYHLLAAIFGWEKAAQIALHYERLERNTTEADETIA